MATKYGCAGEVKKLEDFMFLDEEYAADIEEAILDILTETKSESSNVLQKELRELLQKESFRMRNISMQKIRDSFLRQKNYKEALEVDMKVTDIKSVKDMKKYIKTINTKMLNKIEGENSVSSLTNTERTNLTNAQYGALKKAGVYEEYWSGDLDVLVKEHNIRIRDNKPGIDKDPPKGFSEKQIQDAIKIYDVTKKTSNMLLENQRSAGLNINERKEWLYSFDMDVNKLIALKFDGFMKLVDSFVDKTTVLSEATLKKSPAEQRKVWKEYYDAYIEAKTSTDPEMVLKGGFLGKLKSRKLSFKSGFDEHAFFAEVNGKSLAELVETNIQQGAKAYGVVSHWGAESQMNFKKLLDDVNKHYVDIIKKKDFDPLAVKELKEYVHSQGIGPFGAGYGAIEDAFHEAALHMTRPASTTTTVVQVLRQLNALSKLGGTVFTSLFDVMSISQQYARSTGENQVSAFIKTSGTAANVLYKDITGRFSNSKFGQLLGFESKAEYAKEMGEVLNVMTYIHDPAIALGMHSGDLSTGFKMWDRAVNLAMRSTGVPWQTELSRVVGGMMQARALKHMAENFSAGKVNPLQKLKMKKYGLSNKDMELLSSIQVEENMPNIIATRHIMEIPLEKFHKNLNVAAKKRRELFDKVANYMDDAVQAGTPTPGLREKRILGKGISTEKEWQREMLNLVMQFKETATKIALDNIQAHKDFNAAHGFRGNARNLGAYAINGMAAYFMIQEFKSAVTGTRSPTEMIKDGKYRDVMFDYINKSSFLPLVTDFAEAATGKRRLTTVPNMIFGPSYAMGMDIGNLVARPAQGKDIRQKDIGRALQHFVPSTHFGLKFLNKSLMDTHLLTGEQIRK